MVRYSQTFTMLSPDLFFRLNMVTFKGIRRVEVLHSSVEDCRGVFPILRVSQNAGPPSGWYFTFEVPQF